MIKRLKYKETFIILTVLLTSTCALSQLREAIDSINSVRSKIQIYAEQNQFHKVAEHYTKDAIINGFDGIREGMSQIKNYWQNIKGTGVRWEWENLRYSGNENYVTQTGISQLTLKYGDTPITYSSYFSVIWMQQPDGTYKIISDFYRQRNESDLTYTVEMDSIWVVTETDSIFGILFTPKELKTAKIPAILCLQGGGEVGLPNYFLEAKYFAENGLIALLCDKSGSGRSKGKSSWVNQSFQDKTQEYYRLIQWLQKQPNVNNQKIGVHGLSEGGRLALNLAINYPEEIAFVNAVSAPIESFKENQLFAIYHFLQNRNYNFSTINQVVNIWNEYYTDIANHQIQTSTIQKIEALNTKNPNLYLPANSLEMPTRPRAEDINFALNELKSIKCPVLFQYGENDTRVNVSKSISLIDKKTNFNVIAYEQTDHSMVNSNGNLHDYYLEDKSQWLERNKLYNQAPANK